MPLSLDFAFEGFRIIREKPKLILFWGLVLLIGGTLSQVLMVAIAGPDFERMQALGPERMFAAMSNPTPDPGTLAMAQNISTAFAAAVPILLITSAILSCAVFRATWVQGSRGIQESGGIGGRADDRFGYLRVGIDEARQLVVTILYYVLAMVLILADSIVSDLVASVAGGAIVAAALSLAGLVVVALLLVRLSLCGVQSFDRKKIDVFGSWTLTSKQGWTLVGGYVVTGVMTAFVYLLCTGIFGAFVVAINGAHLAAVNHLVNKDATSMQAYFTPLTIAWTVIGNMLVSPLLVALMTGAQAAAYRTLAGQIPDSGI